MDNLQQKIFDTVYETRDSVGVIKNEIVNIKERITSIEKMRFVADVNFQNENIERDEEIKEVREMAEKINTQWKFVAILIGISSPIFCALLVLFVTHFWK
jgi:hypothetical protein